MIQSPSAIHGNTEELKKEIDFSSHLRQVIPHTYYLVVRYNDKPLSFQTHRVKEKERVKLNLRKLVRIAMKNKNLSPSQSWKLTARLDFHCHEDDFKTTDVDNITKFILDSIKKIA
ncbi:hypothetical protein HZB02_01490 [Candidatus Woesearchaeota archaeon]|nr:hypothetical protein [Candidatus Woesearchaeota archaeon]